MSSEIAAPAGANDVHTDLANAGAFQPAHPSIVLAATFTVDPLVESLSLFMAETGLGLGVAVAPYGQVFQELLDPNRQFSSNRAGVNVVLVRFEDWCSAQQGGGATLDRDAGQRNANDLITAVRAAAARITTPIVLSVCPPSPERASDAGTMQFLASLESQLVSGIQGLSSVRFLSVDWAKELDAAVIHDAEGDRLGHVPYTATFFAALGAKLSRFVHVLKSPPHKVLALDCDNTLWKGVVGEDGVHGIEITERHRALQRFALEKKRAGMIICLVSKNVESDVLEVFRERRDMVLTAEDIVTMRVNWLPKSENLRSLAAELNLGLDSFVFVDDNPVECAEVEAGCPGVLALELPVTQDFPAFLRNVWPLDHLDVTAEDAKRTELYRQNLERDRYQKSATNMSDFLAGLDLQIDVAPPRPDQLARAAQLTQRTNQFNFTTRRRTEGEIAQLAADKKQCRVVEVKDRFGDYGLVGLVIFGTEADDLVVDTMLLSCRVLGRGVEHAMVRELGIFARERALSRVVAPFVPTKKNLPAARFLESLEATTEATNEGTRYVIATETAAALAQVLGQGSVEVTADEAAKPIAAASPVGGRNKSARWNRIARELDSPAKILSFIEHESRRERTLDGEVVAPRTDTERRLVAIWLEVLHLPVVGIRDDYFVLGGTSLLAVTIFARLEREIGKRLPLAVLVESPTIESLAARLDQPSGTHSLVVLNEGTGESPPLFLVHDADGETLLYRNLARRIGGRRTVYGIQPEGQSDTPIVHTRISEMARHYVSEIRRVRPRGPYLLGGLCAGATVAFEMASQLEASNEEARLVAVFDAADVEAPLKPHLESTRRLDRVRAALRGGSLASVTQILASKARGYVTFQAKSAVQHASERLAVLTLRWCLARNLPLPAWARNLPVRTVYTVAEAEYRPRHVVDQEILLFRATSGVGADEPFKQLYDDPKLGWGKRTAKGVQAIDVPGGHGTMLQEPHVAVMADALRDYLLRSDGEAHHAQRHG